MLTVMPRNMDELKSGNVDILAREGRRPVTRSLMIASNRLWDGSGR
jgi:hypothetical protein